MSNSVAQLCEGRPLLADWKNNSTTDQSRKNTWHLSCWHCQHVHTYKLKGCSRGCPFTSVGVCVSMQWTCCRYVFIQCVIQYTLLMALPVNNQSAPIQNTNINFCSDTHTWLLACKPAFITSYLCVCDKYLNKMMKYVSRQQSDIWQSEWWQ